MRCVNMKQLVPDFIYSDANGHALSAAIERAMQIMIDTLQGGLNIIIDVDEMPQWRLDEMAWETNCLYDFGADIATKRKWIKNAIPMYQRLGTQMAVFQYLDGYFDAIDLEENWQYGGEAYHFRVTVEGEWTPENEAWARKAIAEAKNVRSVLDNLRIGSKCKIGIIATGSVLARFAYPVTGAENWVGRWPQENTKGVLDESGRAGLAADAVGYPFPYEMTGTQPEISTAGVLGEIDIPAAHAEDTYARILYKLCGQDEI